MPKLLFKHIKLLQLISPLVGLFNPNVLYVDLRQLLAFESAVPLGIL